MKILAIETSCDETAISIADINEIDSKIEVGLLAHLVSSQIEMHKEWGGVVPNIAKREHQLALVPLLKQALTESKLIKERTAEISTMPDFKKILEREPELLVMCENFLPTIDIPEIDAVAVTTGPGLEPALWVGINFAKAISTVWNKPLIPVNHMEGHILSSLLERTDSGAILHKPEFPAMALLVSGGHTELVLMKDWLSYELVGKTRDDAVGEAFDKVARLMGLPYPGGPQISRLASEFETSDKEKIIQKLPRPMLGSGDFDFSFSGLKTSVRYMIEKMPQPISEETKKEIAYEFEEAIVEVLIAKTVRAVKDRGAMSLVAGGGVIANKKLRTRLKETFEKKLPGCRVYIPENLFTTDNATMIALSGYFQSRSGNQLSSGSQEFKNIKANGTLKVHHE